ncbi:competence type IV pilus assembly protein ComGB [Pseudalkalibacillus caeni]|uniref:Type II secretion system F family protein n=1 Tax=Exobacillus caeni TaxID=2574798 RepID=A0A5R9EZX8_9BACL|nr:competence type IV pilus assembly protein ComGB [Pseudalkalibacillus caeni]TLS36341.1 type II secretion system F family protein [Pseudalkalibacillus caeni]
MADRQWKLNEKADFLLRVGQLLEEGYTLSQGMELYAFNQREAANSRILKIVEQLKGGNSLHQVLQDFEFPPDILCYLYITENEQLSNGLKSCGEMLHYRCEVKARLRTMMRYPLVLFWITSVMLLVVTVFLLPQFSTLYQSLEIPLPIFTKGMILLSKNIPLVLLLCLFPFGALFFYYVKQFRHYHPEKQIQVLLKIPFLKPFIKIYLTQYLSSQLGILLFNGRTVGEALGVFLKQDHLLFFKEEAGRIKSVLQDGESFEKAITEVPYYLTELSAVISHGQSNGQLGKELLNFGGFLTDQFEERVKRAFGILQPVSFACIGVMILMMFLSILLPMFQYIQAV